MKKTLPLVFSALLSVTAAMAQPTLTAATSNPAIGTSYIYYASNITAQGAAGPNVTWDFSTATQTGTSTIVYAACSTDAHCATFSSSNPVAAQQGPISGYLAGTTTKQSIVGAFQTGLQTYTNPEDLFRFPFTYNTTYIDTLAATYVSNNINYYRKGTIQVTGDAYGTLKSPIGTFTNVIRIHRHEVYSDSSSLLIGGFSSDVYSWYSAANKEVLLSVQTSTTTFLGNSTTNKVSYYTNQHPADISELNGIAASLQIAPNPATDVLNISFAPTQNTALQIALFDITGRRVQELNNSYSTGEHSVKMDVSTLPKGMYLLKLNSEGQNVTRKINIQ